MENEDYMKFEGRCAKWVHQYSSCMLHASMLHAMYLQRVDEKVLHVQIVDDATLH